MHISRGKAGLAGALLLAALLLGACGSSPAKPVAAATSAAPVTPLPAATTPSEQSTIDGITVDPFNPNPANGATATPDFSQLGGTMPTPAKRLLPGSYGTPIEAVPYALSVIKSSNTVWDKYLAGDQLERGRTNVDLMSPGDGSNTACHDGTINQDYPSMVYCRRDDSGRGQILIPMTLLASQWGHGLTRQQGDLAVAIALTRQTANPLITSLANQMGLPRLSYRAQLYVGACLSGVWAYAVYPQGTFSNNDAAQALDRTAGLTFELDGAKVKPDPVLIREAWISGYASGRPLGCAQNFWMHN